VPLKTQAATEIAQFLANHPTPEQIIAFHPSSEVAERAYELIHTERDGSLTEEERKELDSYLVIEYLMELVKLEAHRQLRQQAANPHRVPLVTTRVGPAAHRSAAG
jgi:hypothetical protein